MGIFCKTIKKLKTMKAILDTISLCEMIANNGLKNDNWKDTVDFVKEHFANTQFENEMVKQRLERLAYKIVDLRTHTNILNNQLAFIRSANK